MPSQPCLCSPLLRLSSDAREHDGLANDCRTIAPRYAWTCEERAQRRYSRSEANVNVPRHWSRMLRPRTIACLHNLQISVQLRGLPRSIALSPGAIARNLKLIIISQKLSVAGYVVTSHLLMLDVRIFFEV